MARQTRTQAQIDQVNNDFETFFLPVGASLDLGDFTTYGATDPAVDLSMVNTRFLKDYSSFRGTWSATPVSGGQPIAYTAGDIVVGSDNHIYALSTLGTGTNDPATAGQTDWTLLSSADVLGARAFNTSTTYTMNHMVFRGGSNPDEAGLLYVYISSTDQTGTAAPLPAVGTLSNANWMQVGGAPSDRDEQTKIFTTANASTYSALTDLKPLDIVYVATLREWRQISTVDTDGTPLTHTTLSVPEFITLELDQGAAQTYQLAQGDIVLATEHNNRTFVVNPAVADFVYSASASLPDTWIEISDSDLNARQSTNTNEVILTTSQTSIPTASVPASDQLVISGSSGVRLNHTSDQSVNVSYGLQEYSSANGYEIGDLVVDSDNIIYRALVELNPGVTENNLNNASSFQALSDVILPYNSTHVYRANEAVHDNGRLFIAKTNNTNTDPLTVFFPDTLVIDDTNVTITFAANPDAGIDPNAPHYDYSLQYSNGSETISLSFNEADVTDSDPLTWVIPRADVTFTPTPDNNTVTGDPSPITAISDEWYHIGGEGTTIVNGGGGSGGVNLEIEANDVDVTGSGEALDFRFNTTQGTPGAIRGINFDSASGQYIIDLRPPADPIQFSYAAQRGINVGEVLPASLTYNPSISGGDPPYSYSSTSAGVTANSGTGIATVVPATAGLNNLISTAQTLGTVRVEDDAATAEMADLTYTVTDNRGIAFTGGEQLVSRFATGSWGGAARVTNIPETNQGNTRVLYESGEYAGAPLPARSGDNVVLAIPYNLFNPDIANPVDLIIHDARTIDGAANTAFRANRTVSFFSPWFSSVGTQPANLAAMTVVNTAFAASQQRTFTGTAGQRVWVAVRAQEATNGIHFAAGASQTDGQMIASFTMADFTGANQTFDLYRGPALSAASTTFTITRL